MAKPPAVRAAPDFIEIDQKRGKWPFVKLIWGEDNDGKPGIIVIADANESGGMVMTENQNVGIVGISKKKARALRDWLDMTLDEH